MNIRSRNSATMPKARDNTALLVKPATRNVRNDTAAVVITYGNWVVTWFMCSHCAPADDMMVVSEMGEQWSPATAPAIHAEMEMIISCGSMSWKQDTTMGMRMPKVAQDVPEAKASPVATTKMMAGRSPMSPSAEFATKPATKVAAPRLSVMLFSVHANVRMSMAGTICLKPSGRQSIHSLNDSD